VLDPGDRSNESYVAPASVKLWIEESLCTGEKTPFEIRLVSSERFSIARQTGAHHSKTGIGLAGRRIHDKPAPAHRGARVLS
jgi:hypothetical protein